MQKFLPKIKFLALSLLIFLVLSLSVFSSHAFAQAIPTATPIPGSVSEGTWVKDDDVTFAGKVAARSGQFLDWAIANYQWASVSGVDNNPLAAFWQTIETIVLAFAILFVIVTAFIMIVTRGRNITIMRFIPRFVMIVLLIVLSFSIVQFLYQINDAIQGFFLKNTQGQIISQKDLLYVGFDYPNFAGFRKFGAQFDESVFVSLLLVKLTALTYYVMVGILVLRKIILWFFIVISPVFPLLLFYSPIRNTAKIWVGEFFRWLLYAPLFAIFLSGLVKMWSSTLATGTGIPLPFNFNKAEVYPTAISILIGGPGQTVSLTNSVNNPDTFALYVVALLMLWVVIILPFLLLQIFLDFFHEFSFSESNVIKQIIAGGSTIIGRGPGPKTPPPPSIMPTGTAKPLPFTPAKIEIPQIKSAGMTINTGMTIPKTTYQGAKVHSEILNLTNLSIPTMRDIATYETSLISTNIQSHQEVARVHETLEGIAEPRRVTATNQREKYTLINEKLKQEAAAGNPLATSILTAADSVVSKTSSVDTAKITKVITDIRNLENVSSFEERQKLTQVKEVISQAAQRGDPLATSVLASINQTSEKPGKVDVNQNILAQLSQAKDKANPLAVSLLETAGISNTEISSTDTSSSSSSASKLSNVLTNINNIENITSSEEKQKLVSIQNSIKEAAQRGDPLATSITSVMEEAKQEKGKIEIDEDIKLKLADAKEKGSEVAVSVLEAAGITDVKGNKPEAFPQANRVQSVNVEDYESVKKIWKENYQKLEPPKTIDGKQRNRKEWASGDIEKINETITLLSSSDSKNVTKGMERVGTILPFLLIGGFSQTEVVTYLKAKLEAAKEVVEDLEKEQSEEDTMLTRDTKKEKTLKEMEAETEITDLSSQGRKPWSGENEPAENKNSTED